MASGGSGGQIQSGDHWVEEGGSLGWISTAYDPWIYSEKAGSWLYQPDTTDSEGTWTYWIKPVRIEVFEEYNKPEFLKDAHDNFKLQMPWNYESRENAGRKYPLIVALHGSTSSPSVYYTPCIIGKDEQMKQFPCFYLAPNTTSGWGGSTASWLIDIIEELVATYRIDESRIYLIGFSMGGNGTYSLANTYYDYNGRLFAGIIRVVGGYQIALREAIMRNTSIWYHIGLEDRASWVSVARQSYAAFRNYPGNEEAVETSYTGEVYNFPQYTRVLSLGDRELIRLSEYENLGHEGYLPFFDPDVVPWLFRQSLPE